MPLTIREEIARVREFSWTELAGIEFAGTGAPLVLSLEVSDRRVLDWFLVW